MSRSADLDNLYPNNSGEGRDAPVPNELRKWNWGAFAFNWIWGLANDTYIALLCLVPLVNLVMIFVLGAKGNEWAWQNRRWRSIDHFRRVQRGWAIASLVFLLIGVVALAAGITLFSSLFGEVGQLRAMAEERVRSHPAAIAALGEPVSVGGMESFHIQEDQSGGSADLVLSVSGPQASGRLYIQAVSPRADDWEFTTFHLSVTSEEIDLLDGQ